MATIDPSIILQGKGLQLQDPSEAMSRAMTLQQMTSQNQMQQMQLQDARRSQQEQMTLADLYRNNVGPDGKLNRDGLLQGASRAGLTKAVPALQKQFSDEDKARTDIAKDRSVADKNAFEIKKAQLDYVNSGMAALIADPNLDQNKVISYIEGAVQRGFMTPEEGAQRVREIPGPGQLRGFLVAKGRQAQTATEQFMADAREREMTETNRHNLAGERTADGQLKVSQGQLGVSQGNLATTRERLAFDKSKPQDVVYETDANGNMVMLPKAVAPGAKVVPTPLVGADGKPVAGKQAKGSEDENKAAGWLVQTDNAWRNMQKVLAEKPNAGKPGMVEKAVGAIPLVGEDAANVIRTSGRQAFIQATQSMSEALLHAATGAGFSAMEAKSKADELTPKFGEAESVTQQKMEAIPIYLETLKVRAGKPGERAMAAADRVRTEQKAARNAAPAPVDIDAELAKIKARHNLK